MENSHTHHYIAGWAAGMFGIVIGHPMDTIKTHQQTYNIRLSNRQAINMIMHKDGFSGFYKGVLPPLLGSGLLNCVYFGALDNILRTLQTLRGHAEVHPANTGWAQDLFIAGCIGGAAQAFITCPSELIKIRQQLDKGGAVQDNIKLKCSRRKLESYKLIQDIHAKNGIRGFFIGFVPTFWRDTIGGGFYILSYQYTRHYFHGKLNLSPGLFETLVAGGIAGLATWVPVIPFDTIKCRMQGNDIQYPIRRGMRDCSLDIFKRHGYHGFFKGFTMIVMRSVPVNISILCGYELTLWLLRN